jgi:YebC/PmpR family DNA-binding regulatory protein
MSGHSHWATIKHGKEANDKKRSKIFSKMSLLITLAAKTGGDPDMNPSLRLVIDRAKKENMPKDNIERAIKRGTGELVGETLEEFTFEAYGPEKSAIIITGITTNTNRVLNEIKIILNSNNAKMATEGSVKWQFEEKGIIVIKPEDKEKAELKIIDSGAEDFSEQGEMLEIYTAPASLDTVKTNIEKDFNIEAANLGWVAKEEVQVENIEKIGKLLSALDDNDDVQEVYTNIKL